MEHAMVKLVSGLVGLVTAVYAVREFSIGVEFLVVFKELEEIAGEDFAKACLEDEKCFRTIKRIAEESLEIASEEERKRFRERLLSELEERLKEIGVRFYCEERDLGVFGVLFEDCYVEYKGEYFSITKDLDLED